MKSQPNLQDKYQNRRDRVFMVIAGVFLGSLTMMNILGISRFIDLSFQMFGVYFPLLIPIGVLPYPVTFLCTDLVSELYGVKHANRLVLAGLIANLWMLFLLWLVGLLPPLPEMDSASHLPAVHHPEHAFYQIRFYALGGMVSSMLAYLAAQYLDVYLYHFWKKLTQGKHLWLRNNGSTLVSQLVDTVIVVLSSYWLVQAFPIKEGNVPLQLIGIMSAAYLFKLIAALLDTLPFYGLVYALQRYLGFYSTSTAQKLHSI